jgi:hypothetical protein
MKGHTNNPNGRPKGTPNKVTLTIRNWLVELINNNRALIESDFALLEPKDRLAMLEKFLPYLLPKVQTADEVEGACYTKDDVVEDDGWSTDIATARKVEMWFEK